ncbi:hypothetical protein C922_01152 [Plasmodium inui San Antonio 1]|uniref:Skeleton-binding protein 1 n=1 Tax=Plasmodium inui San Antonio 1 TaxID=1237626 RepID=W7AGK0_9APIC|nr:hypothetical protein C922_01152 [Plasmodium inui San Antonio 1]EUD68134.1 hypothetical protein C922_01152 [Plasmodium inui San Antonio 1]
MDPEEVIPLTDASEILDGSFENLNTEEVAALDLTSDLLDVEEVNDPVLPDLEDSVIDDGVVDLADLSDDIVADLADLPDETIPDVNVEGSSELVDIAETVETPENLENIENPGNPEEPILPPPDLSEMFSEESIRKLREAIENSPCYQRRLAAYKQQQERLGKSVDISPSSPMISPLYKLQFFGSYVNGMLQLVRNNYLLLLLIAMLIINGVMFYSYFKGVSDQKKQGKEEKVKKEIKKKSEKAKKETISKKK